MFSKSAVLLLLCLQAFGLMPSGIGGFAMGEEGLAANCTTRLMSAKMGQRHVSDIPFWISVLILPTTLSDCNISLLGRSGLPCVFPRKVIMSDNYQSSNHSEQIVVLGASGTGKSSLANSFLGWRRPRRSLPFPVLYCLESESFTQLQSGWPRCLYRKWKF